MKSRARSESASPLAPAEERRSSQRVIISISVTLHFVQNGRAESVSARTLAVNDHGALLLCPRTFPAQMSLEIENDRTRERISCKVPRAPQATADGSQVPVVFDAPHDGFWHIAFPPTDWKPTDL